MSSIISGTVSGVGTGTMPALTPPAYASLVDAKNSRSPGRSQSSRCSSARVLINWQGALVDGYTVYSQIHDTLPDHVLAEVLQGRITSVEDAEQWWLRTLCHHQGDEDTEPVTDAVDFLLDAGYLTDVTRPDQTDGVAVTELGKLTARLMVGTRIGAQLRADLATLPVPGDPDTAETG